MKGAKVWTSICARWSGMQPNTQLYNHHRHRRDTDRHKQLWSAWCSNQCNFRKEIMCPYASWIYCCIVHFKCGSVTSRWNITISMTSHNKFAFQFKHCYAAIVLYAVLPLLGHCYWMKTQFYDLQSYYSSCQPECLYIVCIYNMLDHIYYITKA